MCPRISTPDHPMKPIEYQGFLIGIKAFTACLYILHFNLQCISTHILVVYKLIKYYELAPKNNY